ncbi:MAG: hypothetical protein EOP38_14845 [Rubrivivax sp.]|nr:MAG: hypothetical protein EOP38_14845 [Rubrivivax sp.]
MNKGRGLVIVIIVGLLLAVGVRLWANAEALAITGPSNLRQGPDGKVYAVGPEQLWVFSDTGDLLQRIPLARFGLTEFVGDFWVNAEQKILLRKQRPQGGIARTLRVVFRIGGDGRDQDPSGQAALQWCSLTGEACRPFGAGFRSTRTFRLAVEPATGAVLIADTAQHRLLRLSAKGDLQATSAAHFQFPNALLMTKDGLLHVADTNHHRIAAVSLATPGFGDVQHAFNVETATSTPGRNWPMGLAQASDGALWTINAGPDMADGDIMVYETDGRFRQKISLPPGADPLSLLPLKDRVLVSDARQFQIGAFDLQGQARRPFGGDAFAQDMNGLKRLKKRYEAISTISLVALFALFGLALWVQRRQR